jgi:hypothetical protein
MALISDAVKRTGMILPFASPFGSLGRPILAFFCAKASKLLYECFSNCCRRRGDRRYVQRLQSKSCILESIIFVQPCSTLTPNRMILSR